jgi:MFS family permease
MAGSRGRTVWSCAVVVVTTVGLLCAFAVWSWQGLATGLVSSAVIALFAALLLGIGEGQRAALRRARLGFAGGLVLTALVALMAVFAVAGACVLFLLVATWPEVHALARKWLRVLAGPAVPTVQAPDDVVASPRDLSRLDDRALCLAWRHSYPLLTAARTSQEWLTVVQRRQEYLDELHRRSPEGLAAWLAAGGRASSNPLPYLATHQTRSDPPESKAS